MKLVMAIGEYLFAIVLGAVMFVWLILCMFAELPGLPRYLRISRM
jgi:hypothetical protein